MSDPRDTERALQAYLANLPTPHGADVDPRVLADALTTMQRAKKQSAAYTSRMTWRTIMTGRMSKLAATVIIGAALFFTFFGGWSKPAWALEQSIAALRDYRAIHLIGTLQGNAVELWARANESASASSGVLIRESRGAVMWTRDGSTYCYEPGEKTVYFEPALTIGMVPWLGPELLETLRTAENTQIIHGKDPATGRSRVTLLCSLMDVHGAQSYSIEFDVASKLPVTLKQWQNMDRSGPPAFEAFQLTYCESLPDSVFDVHIPSDAKYVEKPLQIPGETVGVLGNPQDGISATGLTQQEAADKALRTLYQAVIDQDLDRLKSICPLCRNWGDEFLRAAIFKPDKANRIVEILEVGPIRRTGRSPLGPIAAVPTTVKLKNGRKAEQQMVVQFRQFGDESSCVVHGPYGLPREFD
jgi:hypothetical protein